MEKFWSLLTILMASLIMMIAGVDNDVTCSDGLYLPPGFLPRFCCNRFISIDSRYMRECGDLKGSCLAECFINYTSVLTANKTLNNNSTAILRAYNADITDDNANSLLIPVFTAGLRFCIDEANNRTSQFNDSLGQQVIDHIKVCSNYSLFLDECTSIYEYAYCPDAFFEDNADCNRLKDFYKKCPIPEL